jgi:hypothetical protein
MRGGNATNLLNVRGPRIEGTKVGFHLRLKLTFVLKKIVEQPTVVVILRVSENSKEILNEYCQSAVLLKA